MDYLAYGPSKFFIQIFQSVPSLYDMFLKRFIIDMPFSSFLRIPLNFGRPFFQKFGLKPIPCFLKKEGLKGGSGQITRTGSSGFATSWLCAIVVLPKGQLISKQDCQAITSPKKRTLDFYFFKVNIKRESKKIDFLLY